MSSTRSRRAAFGWILVAYAVAITAAFFSLAPFHQQFAGHEHEALLVAAGADVVGTLVIFGFSFAFKNSSFYDAYWSVIPPLLGAYFWWSFDPTFALVPRKLIALALTTWWAVRLTHNWARGWTGLHHIDWRYVDLKRKTGGAYWAVSLFGIHLFPTAQVFAGCFPLYFVMQSEAPLGAWDIAAAIVTSVAIVIETVSDNQLRRFVKTRKPGELLASGLWRYSRHPNYFGEMMFWIGLALFTPHPFWAATGAVTIALMFIFISVPMIDERSRERRPGYEAHMKKTSAIIPLPPRA